MTYCPSCGAEIDGDSEYCPQCGNEVSINMKNTDGQESAFPTGRKLTLGGMVLVVVGGFLPWVSVSVLGTNDSVIGIDTLGFFTVALAAVIGVLVLLSWSTTMQTFALLSGIGIVLVSVWGIADPIQLVEVQEGAVDEGLIQPDNGLYATIVGGILVLAASGYAIKNEGQKGNDEDEEPSFFTLYWLPGFDE